jgi:hypothetical protein
MLLGIGEKRYSRAPSAVSLVSSIINASIDVNMTLPAFMMDDARHRGLPMEVAAGNTKKKDKTTRASTRIVIVRGLLPYSF